MIVTIAQGAKSCLRRPVRAVHQHRLAMPAVLAETRKNVRQQRTHGAYSPSTIQVQAVAIGDWITNLDTSPIALFVIDDDARSRKAMAALASSLKIPCETFASAEAFLDRYDPSLTGCVLIDFRLGDMDGLQLQERLLALSSTLSVVIVSANADVPMAVRALENGAVAIIEKPYKNDELADAIRKAIDRSVTVRQSLSESADERCRFASLTPRELQVLNLLLAGTPQKRMVPLLKVSRRTVNRLLGSVYSKMGVNSAAELAGMMARLEQSASNDNKGSVTGAMVPVADRSVIPQHQHDDLHRAGRSNLAPQPMITCDLHAGFGEYLSTAVMYLGEYERCRDDQPEVALPLFQKAIGLLRKSLDALRGQIPGLHQATSEVTLKAAVQELIDEFENK
jgi:FixJ family two-component response regulator